MLGRVHHIFWNHDICGDKDWQLFIFLAPLPLQWWNMLIEVWNYIILTEGRWIYVIFSLKRQAHFYLHKLERKLTISYYQILVHLQRKCWNTTVKWVLSPSFIFGIDQWLSSNLMLRSTQHLTYILLMRLYQWLTLSKEHIRGGDESPNDYCCK